MRQFILVGSDSRIRSDHIGSNKVWWSDLSGSDGGNRSEPKISDSRIATGNRGSKWINVGNIRSDPISGIRWI